MQDTKYEETGLIDWSRELWFALLFICIGWTVWPLMVYFLGRAIEIEYFINMTLRDWAENRVYGPIVDGGLRTISRITFLFFPWFFSFCLRLFLNLLRNNGN